MCGTIAVRVCGRLRSGFGRAFTAALSLCCLALAAAILGMNVREVDFSVRPIPDGHIDFAADGGAFGRVFTLEHTGIKLAPGAKLHTPEFNGDVARDFLIGQLGFGVGRRQSRRLHQEDAHDRRCRLALRLPELHLHQA